jgi:hypothetical protein
MNADIGKINLIDCRRRREDDNDADIENPKNIKGRFRLLASD